MEKIRELVSHLPLPVGNTAVAKLRVKSHLFLGSIYYDFIYMMELCLNDWQTDEKADISNEEKAKCLEEVKAILVDKLGHIGEALTSKQLLGEELKWWSEWYNVLHKQVDLMIDHVKPKE